MAKRDTSIPKNVVKSHLRKYMLDRCYELQNEVKKGAAKVIDTILDPILATMFNELAEMERNAQRYVDLATEYLNTLPTGKHLPYGMRDAVTYTNNHFSGIRKDKRRELKLIAANVIARPESDVFVNSNEELVTAVRGLQETMKSFYEKLKNLDKLKEDVDLVIETARSGKDAFIQLRNLGIDMSDYRRDETLPAIVQLPNVSLLNNKEET